MEEKIKLVAEKIDSALKFSKISQSIENKWLRIVVNALEMVDGTIAKAGLSMMINKIKPQYHPIVEIYLDCIINDDYEGVALNTANVLNALVDIPGVEEDREFAIFHAALLAILDLLPNMMKSEVPTEV